MPRSRNYQQELFKALQDPQEASAYLNAALEDGDETVFLLALRDVVDAGMGMSQLAQASGRNRESLYKTLSDKGNPHLKNVRSILSSLGYRLAVEIDPQQTLNPQ